MKSQQIFLSYSRSDEQFAQRLFIDLKNNNYNVWRDRSNISYGKRWPIEVEKALLESNRLLVILSPEAMGSQNVKDEIDYFLKEDKIIIPILLKKCQVYFRIQTIQHVDFSSNYDQALSHLIYSLNRNITSSLLDNKSKNRKSFFKILLTIAMIVVLFSGSIFILNSFKDSARQKKVITLNPDSIALSNNVIDTVNNQNKDTLFDTEKPTAKTKSNFSFDSTKKKVEELGTNSVKYYKNKNLNDQILNILKSNRFSVENEKLKNGINKIDFNIYDSSHNNQTILNTVYFKDELIDDNAVVAERFPLAVTQWVYYNKYNTKINGVLLIILPVISLRKIDTSVLSKKYSLHTKDLNNSDIKVYFLSEEDLKSNLVSILNELFNNI